MQSVRSVMRVLSQHSLPTKFTSVVGMKTFPKPPTFDDVEFPERTKLPVVLKVPHYPATMGAFHMQKKLRLMRGPEKIHNTLLHKQFGIVALKGGRLRHGHFEMIRMTLIRKIDYKRMFAIWRVDAPWQPVSKKSLGHRMGGGKGGIDHYVTPVKSGRVIVEVGGKGEFFEVERVLKDIANKLPFDAKAVCQKDLDDMAAEEKKLEEENLHPFTWKYVIQNNMLGCNKWISRFDKHWYNKHR